MGVGEGDDRDGREKYGQREKKRERETGMGEKKIERQEREREIGRATGVGERERQGRKRKNYIRKKIHGILSCRTSFRITE